MRDGTTSVCENDDFQAWRRFVLAGPSIREALGMAKKRELREAIENGVQFGACSSCGWEYRCPPLFPNDEQSQGALDQAFDRHVCDEHPRPEKETALLK
jgi:hypothetical protein